jgi:hypothetical protein
VIKYIFGVIFIAIIFFFKPITIHFTQIYTSSLLEQNVQITSFTLFPLKAEAYVEDPSNKVTADVKSIIPLKVLATYSGDIDAFKTFHPLLGPGVAKATVTYDNKLIVKGEASLYGSKTKVIVKQLPYNWYVSVDASSLDLKAFQKQNSQELGIDAKIDLKLTLITDANTSLDLSTKSLNVSGQVIKDIDIKLIHKDDKFKINSSFKPPNFYKTTLKASGFYKDTNITAYTSIGFKDENIIINDLNFNTENFHTTIHTSSFGGELDASYKDDYLFLDAKNLHLSKVLKTAQQKVKARGYINIAGKLDIKKLTTTLSFYSPSITTPTQKLGSLKVLVPYLKYKDDVINASTKIIYEDLLVDIDKIKINTKTLQTSLHTSSFGGNLDATYKKDILHYNARHLHLSKVLKAAKQKPMARGELNLKGKLDIKTLDTDFVFSSPWLVYDKQKIEKVKLRVPNLKYKDKKLTTSYKLRASFMKKLFTFKGDIYFKDILKLSAKSNDFKGKTELHLDDKKFDISMKRLDLEELQKFASKKPQASGLIDIDAKGDFKKVNFSIKTDAKVKKHDIHAEADGSYDIKSKQLESNFKASLPLKKDSFDISGKASYKNDLKLHVYSSSFESQTFFKLEAEHFKFQTRNLNLHGLTTAIDRPKIFYGYVDVEAQGNIENIDFKINSEELRRNFKLGRIDNFISLDIQGNYTPELLTIEDDLMLNYKKDHIPLHLDLKIEPKAPFRSKGSLSHKQDKLVVNSFSYENEQVKSEFLFDVQELNLYRALMANTFRGPMRIDGTYQDALNIKTNSLGGELKFVLNKKIASLNLESVDATKVAKLVEQEGILSSGIIDGNATYDIKEKTAKTDIALTSAVLNGINIDEKISNVNNAMGLNVLSMSKSIFSSFSDVNQSHTNINHLQLNATLKDKNIKLDDVAFRTDKFLIAAIGDFEQNGDINSLDVSIVDKQGCSIITQALSGNIKDPKAAETTSTIVNIVERVPTSILKTGRKILNFGTETIDDVASFGVNQVFRTDANISITSDVISESSSLIESTSDFIRPNIIMPKGCNVIYDGKVIHPKNLKKEPTKEN